MLAVEKHLKKEEKELLNDLEHPKWRKLSLSSFTIKEFVFWFSTFWSDRVFTMTGHVSPMPFSHCDTDTQVEVKFCVSEAETKLNGSCHVHILEILFSVGEKVYLFGWL